jgi:hypothetical protein
MSDRLALPPASDPLSAQNFEHSWRVAKVFAASTIIPDHFRGKPEQCMVALALAQSLDVAPLIAMQNSFVVHGTPGLKASFVIGLVNQRGPFDGVIQYEETGSGESLAVRAFAKVKGLDQVAEFTASMKMAKAEGWTKNPKYQTMPGLMLRYRAATLLARLYCPEVLLGFATDEELDDVRHASTKPAPALIATLNAEAAASKTEVIEATHDPETGEVFDEEAEEAKARELERKLLEGATA